MSKAKVLILDIETRPTTAYVWQAFKANVGINQIKKDGCMMCYAAKWLGEDKIIYEETRTTDDKAITKSLIKLMDKADVIIAHNAIRFDIPTILGRALVHKINPPSPFKIIDTLQVAKRNFRLFRNNLEYIAQILKCAPKKKHEKFPGMDLWIECMEGNDEAWEEMRVYNIQDVQTLEEVYLRMRPYVRNHPNLGVFTDEEVPMCPKCQSKNIHYRGYAYTNTHKYRRFQCQDCGGWGRERFTSNTKGKSKTLVTNAVN